MSFRKDADCLKDADRGKIIASFYLKVEQNKKGWKREKADNEENLMIVDKELQDITYSFTWKILHISQCHLTSFCWYLKKIQLNTFSHSYEIWDMKALIIKANAETFQVREQVFLRVDI